MDSILKPKLKPTNPLLDKAHPIWDLIRLTVIMGFGTAFLYITATNFDATEIRALIGILVAGGIPTLIQKWLGSK